MNTPQKTQAKAGEKFTHLGTGHPRTRHGCDGCHEDKPTERFVGFCGHALWICEACFGRMTDWPEDKQVQA